MRLNDICRGYTLRIAIVTMFALLLLSNGAGAITPGPDLSGGTILVGGAATATFTVNAQGGADYTKIQDAIDNAFDGYTIIVSGGTTSTLTYYENVNVNKRLILHGIDNGAGQPVVDAGGSGSAITLSTDWISLDGFKAVNSGYLYPDAGVRIISNNNFITNNSASDNALGMIIDMNSRSNDIMGNTFNYNRNGGLYLHVNSRNNIIRDNTADHNTNYFIYLADSNYNTVSGNRVSGGNIGIYLVYSNSRPDNGYNRLTGNDISNTYYEGILLYYADNNTIAGNSVNSSNGYGIHLYSSSNNVIYDNYFDNVNNMASEDSINIWNIGQTPGRNIIGGEYLGGNYWAGPNLTGFSQTCADTDHDGICDNPYSLESNNTDYLPLTDAIFVDQTPVANAGLFQLVHAGDTVYFDGSRSSDDNGIVLYEWDFESDGIYDAAGIIASHIYTSVGNYTVTLRVKDTANQTDTDMAIVVVNEPVYSGVISSLVTDKPKYMRGQTAYTTAAITNTGNRVLDAQIRFTYQKPDLSIAYMETKPVSVQISSSVDVLSGYTIPTKGSTQGTWTVKTELLYGNQILDTRTTTFQGVNKL